MSEESQISLAPTPVKPARSRRLLWIAGGVALVIVLVGAAFLAGRLLNAKTGPSGGMNFTDLGNGASAQSIEIDMGEPPEELPRTSPDVTGTFVKRNDNILTVGTFNPGEGMSVVTSTGEGGVTINNGNTGPQVEVVVTKETKLYRDATFDDLKGGMPDFSQKIQQKVAEASLDEIGQSSFITAWGRKSGDRIIADVLFFNSPILFQAPE